MLHHPKSPDWEAIERLSQGCASVFESMFGNAERGVVDEVLLQIELGIIPAAYSWPEIVRIEQEFPVPRGRVDILLFHVDGSLTAIECKASNKAREVLHGVGQVMSYGIMLGYSRTATKIRLALASRARASELRPYRQVFLAAKIEPIFVGMYTEIGRAFAVEHLSSNANDDNGSVKINAYPI